VRPLSSIALVIFLSGMAEAATILTDPGAAAAAHAQVPGYGDSQEVGFEELSLGVVPATEYAAWGLEIDGPSPRVVLPTAFGTAGVGQRVLAVGYSATQGPEVHLRYAEPQRMVSLVVVDAGPGLLADVVVEGHVQESLVLPVDGEGLPGGQFLALIFDGPADELRLRAPLSGDGFGLDELVFGIPGTVDNDLDGASEEDGDCDDGDPSIVVGAFDGCDGKDNDCDGLIDEAADADADHWSTCMGDCDDLDPTRAPDQPEVCANGVDEDCDGFVDEDADSDGDGYSPCEGDCDDALPDAVPGAAEVCDETDNDCDGIVDEAPDADGDGFTGCEGDCDDADPLRVPGPSCEPSSEAPDDDPTREDIEPVVHIPGIGGGGCDCSLRAGDASPILTMACFLLLSRRRP
jgi:hypothetical protein